jgi:hypothetical protein
MAPVLMCVNVYEYVVCHIVVKTNRTGKRFPRSLMKSQLPSVIGCLKSHEGVLFATQAQTVHAALITRPFCVRCRGLEPSWWRGARRPVLQKGSPMVDHPSKSKFVFIPFFFSRPGQPALWHWHYLPGY